HRADEEGERRGVRRGQPRSVSRPHALVPRAVDQGRHRQERALRRDRSPRQAVNALAPRPAGALANLSRHLDQAAEVVTSTLLAVVVLINGVELVGRNFFNYSHVWVHELNLLLGTWTYFIGMTLVYSRNADITVDYFTNL